MPNKPTRLIHALLRSRGREPRTNLDFKASQSRVWERIERQLVASPSPQPTARPGMAMRFAIPLACFILSGSFALANLAYRPAPNQALRQTATPSYQSNGGTSAAYSLPSASKSPSQPTEPDTRDFSAWLLGAATICLVAGMGSTLFLIRRRKTD